MAQIFQTIPESFMKERREGRVSDTSRGVVEWQNGLLAWLPLPI